MAFHGAKINVLKCSFAFTKIYFLGWFISRDFLIADPRRIEKIRQFEFPANKKNMRGFLGLVNSLRRVISIDVIAQLSVLTPLTSSKADYNPTDQQIRAFESIKTLLVEKPLFSHLIDEKAEKILFVDAATSTGVLGGVLAQKKKGVNMSFSVPTELDLENKVHRIIFDKRLPYVPSLLFTKLPVELPKPSLRKTVPPNIHDELPLLGYTEHTVKDSFFWSTISILALYGCKPPGTPLELRKASLKQLKKGVLANKLRDFTFNLNFNKYHAFMDSYLKGTVSVDQDFYLIEALAEHLFRPIVIISTLSRHDGCKIIKYNQNSEKPPLVYGLQERGGHEIFTPFFLNKNTEFNIDSLRDKVEIISYIAKVVPEEFKNRPILDLEVFALLSTLFAVEKFISNVPVTVLTDSRVLFYLFSSKVHNSSVKIRRWCLKLVADYPNVTLHFVKSGQNLADFLTRAGLPEGDLDKFNVKNVKIADFFDDLPKPNFTIEEWVNFVNTHPHYLTVTDEQTAKVVNSVSMGLKNIQSVMRPLEILQSRLSRSEIIRFQKSELSDIYLKCLASDDFLYTEGEKDYKLVMDLLMIKINDFKIYIPPTLIGPLLAYTHLLGHKGLAKMLKDLESFYFDNLHTVTKNFITSCYSCFLSYTGSRKQKLGIYPVPLAPMVECTADIAENLNPVNGYAHLLLVKCLFSDFCLIFPLKTKKSAEISRLILYSVCQHFNVKKLHTDNGPGFRAAAFLKEMSALGIQVVSTAALHPAGRGTIERFVGTVKTLMKKLVATNPTYDWQLLPFIISKTINNTISLKTNFTPAEMVYGKSTEPTFLELEKFSPPNYFVKNDTEYIKSISDQITASTQIAKEAILQMKIETTEKANEKRVEKSFKPNDIVFVVDTQIVPGNSRVLRTKLSPSPYVVIRSLWTTTIIRRISDGYTTLYHNSILKKYDHTSPLFATLPAEVSHVLLHKFADFLDSDFNVITQYDPLDEKLGIQLFDPESDENLNSIPTELKNIEHEIVQENAVVENNTVSESDSDSSDDESEGTKLRSGRRVRFAN